MLSWAENGLAKIRTRADSKYLRIRFRTHDLWDITGIGRYREGETVGREAIVYLRQVDDVDSIAQISMTLGYIVGMQEKFDQASVYFAESRRFYEKTGVQWGEAVLSGFEGRNLA